MIDGANTNTSTALGADAPAAGNAPAAGTQTGQQAASGATNGGAGAPAANGTANAPQNGAQTDPAGGTQAGGTALGAAPAAQPIEVTLPDGVQVDEKLLEAVKATAKDSKSAQALVDTYVQAQQAQMEQFRQQHEQRKADWLNSLKADKEFGGDDVTYNANLNKCHQVLNKFADKELIDLLNDTGLGNMPAVGKFVLRIAKVLSDDTIAGSTSSAPTGAPADPFLNIYTTMSGK